jgi:hypothetical protein
MKSIIRTSILFLLLSISNLACTSNSAPTPEQSVEEIMAAPSIRNSDIVRSPVSANAPTDTNNVAKMLFSKADFDFGEVIEGKVVEHIFTFKNTGKQALLISNARSTCGCTVPEWPRDPIMPGEEGVIQVRFNTENKVQQQVKPINITANTYPATNTIYLRGFVKPKEST